jgi:outer membrane immunogenic protein
MSSFRRFVLTLVAALGLALPGVAFAADLPSRTYAPAPVKYVANSVYDWSGLYVGLQAARGFNGEAKVAGYTLNADGYSAGVTGGYNIQSGAFVYGIEGDLSVGNINAERTISGVTVRLEPKYFGTVRGRVGYAFDNILVFATGGAYLQQAKLNVVNYGSDTQWTTGWVVGAGVEYGITKAISAKAEYLYVKTGKQDYTLPGVGPGSFGVGAESSQNIGRIGLNLKL